MAQRGADGPLWGSTATTFLEARSMWDEAARADGEGSIRAQAILDWRPSTRTRYRSAITQLVETERLHPALGLQEVLAESLATRSGQGQSASAMRGIFAAVWALEDLCILPPTVLPLHRRIAGGGSQPNGQDYATPPMLREIWSSARTDQQRVVAALGVLSWVCFLRVGEAAGIRPCDVEDASLVFFRSKPRQQGWHRRPLARYPAEWAGWLRDYARGNDVPWDARYAAGGAPALERGLAELLAGTRWMSYAWHCFRRGGAGASWGPKPNLPYFKWWGGWTDTPTAMRYATAFKDPEVLGPLQLPSPSSQPAESSDETVTNCIAVWGGGMFGADKLEEDSGYVGPVHLPPPPGDRQTDTVDHPAQDGSAGDAMPDPPEETDTSSSEGSDSDSTSSSGVEIIEPLAGRHPEGTQPAFRIGVGGGGGVRSRKRRRPGTQGRGSKCPAARTAKRVVPVGVPGSKQRKGAPGEKVGVASQSAGQPPTPQRCFVRPRPEQAETGQGPPTKRRCPGPSAQAVHAVTSSAPRGRFEGHQRGRH